MSDREDLLSAEDVVEDLITDAVESEQLESDDIQEEPDSSPDDEVVERAKKYGHLSKEDWIAQGRDPDQWKSPEEFDKTGKILEQLYAMRKKVDQRDREIQALVEYQKSTAKREYERARKELEDRLAASKDDMDMEGVAHYTKELTRLEDMEQQTQVQQYQQQIKEAEERFVERNQHWYNDRNLDLVSRAKEVSELYKKTYPGITVDELAGLIENRIKLEYPDRVNEPVKARPVISSSQSSVNKTVANKSSVSRTFQKLPQHLKETYNVYKRLSPNGSLSEADFINRLKAEGEI